MMMTVRAVSLPFPAKTKRNKKNLVKFGLNIYEQNWKERSKVNSSPPPGAGGGDSDGGGDESAVVS